MQTTTTKNKLYIDKASFHSFIQKNAHLQPNQKNVLKTIEQHIIRIPRCPSFLDTINANGKETGSVTLGSWRLGVCLEFC